jgi:hypothetical protein
MDYHDWLKITGGLLALLLFIPLVMSVLKEGAEGQSCATWFLWGLLDTVLTISVIEQHGNYFLPLGFAIGDVVLVVLLLIKGRFRWGLFETAILAMVIGCLVAWKLTGPKMATISATMGVCVAGIPGWLAMLKHPQSKVGNVWAGYILANALSFFGGTAMTIQERFAPGIFALCSLAMFAASRKKKPIALAPAR